MQRDREYWTIHRGSGFVVVLWFGSSPSPSSSVSKLSIFISLTGWVSPTKYIYRAYWQQGGGGGEEPNHTTARRAWSSINNLVLSGLSFRKKLRAKSYDGEKAWSSINSSISSGLVFRKNSENVGGIFKGGRRLIKNPIPPSLHSQRWSRFSEHTNTLTS